MIIMSDFFDIELKKSSKKNWFLVFKFEENVYLCSINELLTNYNYYETDNQTTTDGPTDSVGTGIVLH
jgi:hypothetical protein